MKEESSRDHRTYSESLYEEERDERHYERQEERRLDEGPHAQLPSRYVDVPRFLPTTICSTTTRFQSEVAVSQQQRWLVALGVHKRVE